MKKFSKLNNNTTSYTKEESLYKDDFIEITQKDGWSIVNSKDCVFCIPYFIETNQFIIRQEYIPSFKIADGQDYHLYAVGGGIEKGETPEISLIRELEEEAGIVLRENFSVDLDKPLFMSKNGTSKVYTCIIPLTENDYHEVVIKGDGSKIEKMAQTIKMDVKYINTLNTSDILTEYLLMKLKVYLNIS